jgi:drug/metabolite transporter (DMT)-like permease
LKASSIESILLAILAATFYGSADFLGGLATRRSSVMPVMIFSQLAGLITLLLVLPLLPTATATGSDFTWGAMAGGALGIGLMLLYQGLATGKMSVVAPVTAVLAVVISAVAGMVIGDRLSWGASAGVALAVAAITLISQDGAHEESTEERGWDAAHGLPVELLAGVLIGVFFIALKQTNPASGLLPLVATRLASLVVLGLIGIVRRSSLRVGRDTVWLIIVGGALDIFANMLYVLAARQGMLTITATLTSLYPASTILLARLVLGERLRRIQIAGLACAVVGIVFIGAGCARVERFDQVTSPW